MPYVPLQSKRPRRVNRAERRQMGFRATRGGAPGYAGQRVAVWGAAVTRAKQVRELGRKSREERQLSA